MNTENDKLILRFAKYCIKNNLTPKTETLNEFKKKYYYEN